MLKAREVEEAARADDLLDQVRNLQTHALDILERAEKAGDLRTALAAISRARSNLELLGKLAETEGLATLHGWLQSGGLFYTPPTQAIVSINNLLHERRRELGIVGVGGCQMSEESYLKDDDLEPIDATVEGSRRRQMGKHILHMWEEGTKHREEVTRSLIDAIGRARIAQEADKARLLTAVGVRAQLRPCWSASSHRTTSKGEGVIPIG